MINQFYGFMAGVIASLLCVMVVSIAKEPQKPAVQQPAGHRYLQRCPGEGLTVEYRSTRRLPEAVVCGE